MTSQPLIDKLESEDQFKDKLGEMMLEVYNWKTGTKKERWRAAAGIAYTEVYQYIVESSLARINIAIDLHGILGKLTAARHAGLSNERLGEIFCREYDNLGKVSKK